MFAISNYVQKYWVDNAHPITVEYPLGGSPIPITFIIFVYLTFVYKIGPTLMKNRPAYNVEPIIQVYNIIQILSNGLLTMYAIYTFLQFDDFKCLTIPTTSEADLPVVNISWSFYMLKLLDMMDTIFFVLRKKFYLITPLHVYHHTMMAISTYVFFRFIPGGENIVMGINNGTVHTFMYFYYFWCLYSSNAGVWWKKYITRLQLLQFGINSIWYTSKLIMGNCSFPRIAVIFVLLQNIIMIKMFSTYYYNAFIKPKPKKNL